MNDYNICDSNTYGTEFFVIRLKINYKNHAEKQHYEK